MGGGGVSLCLSVYGLGDGVEASVQTPRSFSALFAHLFHTRHNLPSLILPFSSVPPLAFRLEMGVFGFDHRKSVLRHIPPANDYPGNIIINVNLEKSSSSVVYEYFAGKHKEINNSYGVAPCLLDSKDKGRVELILKYIEDGDLRRWSLPGIKAFNIGLGEWRSRFNCISNPYMYKQLLKLSAADLIAKGNSCVSSRQNSASKLLEKVFRVRLGRGFYGECLGVRADRNSDLSDEIGKLLSVKSAATGLSTDSATDTSEVAKAYGGGGSPSSSSFIIRMDEYNQWISGNSS
ncbi:hypothetical protein Fmac_005161 [Flemingia macrophylla]|uniref:Uncharacterized protein n=1 Tax=Flemingia macrophylla TaxID=520843 RepID=A0ABD1N7I7_9FABA